MLKNNTYINKIKHKNSLKQDQNWHMLRIKQIFNKKQWKE